MNKPDNIVTRLKSIIPAYAFIPIASMLLLNLAAFFGTRLFTDHMKHYDLSIPLDHLLPFLPIFIIPYALAFAQWIIGYIMIAREGKEYCYRIMIGEMISKVIVGMFFIFLPTIMTRPEVTGTDIFSKAVAVLYKIDAPTNLFPSIHCLESYICMRSALEMKTVDNRYRIAMVVMSILVYLSTLFLKQHVILDFFGAVIVAEAGRFLSNLLFSKLYPDFDKKR